jgi:NAD(P)H-dependent FMN reductase
MASQILIFYGSYRADRMGIRLADFIVSRLRGRGEAAELIDAKVIGLPMLDRMYKEHPPGAAPAAMEALAAKVRSADAFIFVTGEYNWGIQPGLKNLTDHFLEEWFWRPAAIASYSAGRLSGVRSGLQWHGTLSEMGMVVISSTLAVGPIAHTLGPGAEPSGEAGLALEKAFPRFADDLAWWTEAAKAQRARKAPPY